MHWITTEQPYKESWRRLFEYANIELAIERISVIHGKPKDDSERRNYEKQAQQVRACLLQAKEYFDVATTSSLVTQPNHLYYGSVALSNACMLIRGDGKKSLDFLRKDKINAHHGLIFKIPSNIKSSEILENSRVEIKMHGHFQNWYTTLPKTQDIYSLTRTVGQSSTMSRYTHTGAFNIGNIDALAGKKVTLMSLIKKIPDVVGDLMRYNIPVDFFRGEHEVRVTDEFNANIREHSFIIHASPSEEVLLDMLEEFVCNDAVNFCYNIGENKTSGIVTCKPGNGERPFSFPDCRKTLDHKTIFFKEVDDRPEVVDLYLIIYALSMLSRYYPDIWMSFIESRCKEVAIIECLMNIMSLKLPTLMLSQIAGVEHIITTHRIRH